MLSSNPALLQLPQEIVQEILLKAAHDPHVTERRSCPRCYLIIEGSKLNDLFAQYKEHFVLDHPEDSSNPLWLQISPHIPFEDASAAEDSRERQRQESRPLIDEDETEEPLPVGNEEDQELDADDEDASPKRIALRLKTGLFCTTPLISRLSRAHYCYRESGVS